MDNIVNKVKGRIWSLIVNILSGTLAYPIIYRSYWHSLLYASGKKPNKQVNYMTAIPNSGAGIGHQMANWIAGYWFSNQFGLKFAHIAFSNQSWEAFLGFGENEITVDGLIKEQGYKKIRLPLFNESKPAEINLIKKIINSYNRTKVIFVVEHDQQYVEQFGAINELKRRFYKSKARINDNLTYLKENFNICIHVRRGDIVIGQTDKNPNLLLRWQNNEYFKTVLQTALENINVKKSIAIYLFSQGDITDFKEFQKIENLHFCLDMNPQDSFLHMVYADLLITSKSSFSYKPALLNNGVKICPKNFWHGYMSGKDWILAEENGSFDIKQLQSNYE